MRSSNQKAEEDMRIEMAGCGASLPYEMIMEVLKWLPVTSVLRFRSVCRSWAALLSSDEFRSLHMAAWRAPSKLLYIAHSHLPPDMTPPRCTRAPSRRHHHHHHIGGTYSSPLTVPVATAWK
jgi:hypothetical protein